MVNATSGMMGILEGTNFELKKAINDTYGVDFLAQTIP
jgi:hypothetical protein